MGRRSWVCTLVLGMLALPAGALAGGRAVVQPGTLSAVLHGSASGSEIAVSGRLARHPHVAVLLEQRRGSRWIAIARDWTDRNGAYRLAVDLAGSGRVALRTVVRATGRQTISRTLSLRVVSRGAPTIITTQIPQAIVGVRYDLLLRVAHLQPGRWSLAPASLPRGLSLRGGGVVTGTPQAPGTFSLLVRFTATDGIVASRRVVPRVVRLLAPVVATTSLPDGTVGQRYDTMLHVADGRSGTWSADVPPGLTLSSAGELSGSPLQPGTSRFDVSFADARGGPPVSAGVALTVRIDPLAGAISQIAVGTGGACALHATGAVDCWGVAGNPGVLETTATAAPIRIAGLGDVSRLSLGGGTACALRADRTIACWGDVRGLTISGASQTPVPVAGVADAIQVAVGTTHSCAVLSSGLVTCWGRTWYGELGDGSTAGASWYAPVTVAGIADATEVSAGEHGSCALRRDGTVSCWGEHGLGGSPALLPVPVAGISGARAIASGGDETCAVLATGGVDCWGTFTYGSFPDGSPLEASAVPIPVHALNDAVEVDVSDSGDAGCARRSGGQVVCWGWDAEGVLGDGGTVLSPPVVVSPVQPIGVVSASGIGLGSFGCAIRSTGNVACWGKPYLTSIAADPGAQPLPQDVAGIG